MPNDTFNFLLFSLFAIFDRGLEDLTEVNTYNALLQVKTGSRKSLKIYG